MNYKKNFPILNSTGQEISFIQLRELESNNYWIYIKQTTDEIDSTLLAQAFSLAIDESKKVNCNQLAFRFIKGQHPSGLSEKLPSLNFSKKHIRIEYKQLIEKLPDDEGTPIIWKNAKELDLPSEKLAQIMTESAIGDPDYNPNDDALEFIKSYISDTTLTSGLECIHVGFVDSEIAAFAVVQIDQSDGWSRITYMGILPKFRNRGIGKWLHRYCFRQMRTLGGKLYHGGTVATNTAMIKLFLLHNCEKCNEIEEWVYGSNH